MSDAATVLDEAMCNYILDSMQVEKIYGRFQSDDTRAEELETTLVRYKQ